MRCETRAEKGEGGGKSELSCIRHHGIAVTPTLAVHSRLPFTVSKPGKERRHPFLQLDHSCKNVPTLSILSCSSSQRAITSLTISVACTSCCFAKVRGKVIAAAVARTALLRRTRAKPRAPDGGQNEARYQDVGSGRSWSVTCVRAPLPLLRKR